MSKRSKDIYSDTDWSQVGAKRSRLTKPLQQNQQEVTISEKPSVELEQPQTAKALSKVSEIEWSDEENSLTIVEKREDAVKRIPFNNATKIPTQSTISFTSSSSPRLAQTSTSSAKVARHRVVQKPKIHFATTQSKVTSVDVTVDRRQR